METLFNALGEFFRIFSDLIPRFHARPAANQISVVDGWCVGVQRVHRPVLYLPIFDHVEHWDRLKEIPVDPGIQTVTTKDGDTITANVVFWFSIDDPMKTRMIWGDGYEVSMSTKVRAAVTQWHSTKTFDQIIDGDINDVVELLNEDFADAGCWLREICIEERSKTPAIRLYGQVVT